MIEDGIHFGLAEAEYHSDPALGSTDIRRLAVSPVEWWWQSHLNPLKPEREVSDQMRLGSALHSIILEGLPAFIERYAREPQPSDYPGCLKTADDIRRFVVSKGRKPQARKWDLIKQALEESDCPVIWHIVERDARQSGKTLLPGSVFDKAMVSSRTVTSNPQLAPAFHGGVAEVSVFWTFNGVRLKARLDYLKINSTIDLKSFSVKSNGRSIRQSIFQSIGGERYDIQAAHYSNARSQMERFVSDGRVFGQHDSKWITQVAKQHSWKWVWIFYKTTGAPISRGLVFDRTSSEFSLAQHQVTRAIEDYSAFLERFGREAWIDETPIEDIGEGDLPSWIGM